MKIVGFTNNFLLHAVVVESLFRINLIKFFGRFWWMRPIQFASSVWLDRLMHIQVDLTHGFSLSSIMFAIPECKASGVVYILKQIQLANMVVFQHLNGHAAACVVKYMIDLVIDKQVMLNCSHWTSLSLRRWMALLKKERLNANCACGFLRPEARWKGVGIKGWDQERIFSLVLWKSKL